MDIIIWIHEQKSLAIYCIRTNKTLTWFLSSFSEHLAVLFLWLWKFVMYESYQVQEPPPKNKLMCDQLTKTKLGDLKSTLTEYRTNVPSDYIASD